jgi:hypothetical protein
MGGMNAARKRHHQWLTNIWRREAGDWRLFWRHANVIDAQVAQRERLGESVQGDLLRRTYENHKRNNRNLPLAET